VRWSVLARSLAAALLLLTPAAGGGVYPDHNEPEPFYPLPKPPHSLPK
jgi:hypothetical protein